MNGNLAALTASLLLLLHAASGWAEPAPAPPATRILDAADHAELEAGIAMGGLVRVTLLDDRIARVIHSPGDVAAEHDPDEGDIYIRLPEAGEAAPVALFVGSEKGFTYRLTLTPVPGGSAQLLIRNPATGRGDSPAHAGGDMRLADIAALIRAVANRAPLPGFRVEPGGEGMRVDGGAVLEIWRGMHREAWLLALPGDPEHSSEDAAVLADRFGPGIVAAWVDGVEEAGARLAVIVREGGHDDRR